MEIKIVPYEIEHFFIIRESCEYLENLHTHYSFGNPLQLAKMYLRGPAYTMIVGDSIVCSGGVIKLWQGLADAWVLATPLVQAYPKAVTKASKSKLDEWIFMMRLVRLQAIVKVDFEVGHRWIQVLGFHSEGVMRKYFGGMDFVRYARITEFPEG